MCICKCDSSLCHNMSGVCVRLMCMFISLCVCALYALGLALQLFVKINQPNSDATIWGIIITLVVYKRR